MRFRLTPYTENLFMYAICWSLIFGDSKPLGGAGEAISTLDVSNSLYSLNTFMTGDLPCLYMSQPNILNKFKDRALFNKFYFDSLCKRE